MGALRPPERVVIGRVRKYKFANRHAFIDTGLKVLGGYKEDNEQSNPANPLVALLASMKRSALPIVEQEPA